MLEKMRKIGKYGVGGLGIVIAAVAAFFGWQYWQYRQSDEFKALQLIKEWEKKYEEDTHGGETPEETLRLFISALKNNDLELASKYFVVDEWDKWHQYLIEVKQNNLLEAMIEDLQKTQPTEGEDIALFTLVDENNNVISELVMHKNSPTNKWKITEL